MFSMQHFFAESVRLGHRVVPLSTFSSPTFRSGLSALYPIYFPVVEALSFMVLILERTVFAASLEEISFFPFLSGVFSFFWGEGSI